MNVYPRITDIPLSYIIFQEDARICARNCRTNNVEFVGTHISTVINAVADRLSSEGGGSVLVKRGTYGSASSMGVNVVIKDNVHVFLESGVKWYVRNIILGSNTAIIGLPWAEIICGGLTGWYVYTAGPLAQRFARIVNSKAEDRRIQLRNLFIDGRGRDDVIYGRLIDFQNVYDVVIDNVHLYNGHNQNLEFTLNSKNITVTNSVFENPQYSGICNVGFRDCENVVFMNNCIKDSKDLALNIANNCKNVRVIGNLLENGQSAAIFAEINRDGVVMENILVYGNIVKNFAGEGISFAYNADSYINDIKIIGNIVEGCKWNFRLIRWSSDKPPNRIQKAVVIGNTSKNPTWTHFDYNNVLELIVKHNIGIVTENSGIATIPAGSTYVDVSHGLMIVPDPNKIKVTPKDNLGGRSFWISDVTSTTFRINISSADTVDHVFGWSYE